MDMSSKKPHGACQIEYVMLIIAEDMQESLVRLALEDANYLG